MPYKWLPQNSVTGSYLDTIEENISTDKNWIQRLWDRVRTLKKSKTEATQPKRVYIEIGSNVVKNHIRPN